MMRKVFLATTGSSLISNSLLEDKSVHVTGVVDFKTDAPELQNAVLSKGVHYYPYDNMESFGKLIKSLNPDVLLVYKMPFLLPENIFTIPKYGSINIHPSLLPKYRGPNPWFWTYYYMETIGGITIHRIDKFEDHGDILAQRCFEIKLGVELHQLQQNAERLIYPVLSELLSNPDVIEGTPQTSISSDNRAPNVFDYSSIINLKEMDGVRIWHLLRGFPWLLSKIVKKCGHNYKIGDYIFEPEQKKEMIGDIIHENGYDYLYCVNGKILLTDIAVFTP